MTPPPTPVDWTQTSSPAELQSLAGRLIERSSAAMALADLEGRITYVNPAFLALWGFLDASEVLGRHADGDFWMDSEQARAVVAAIGTHGFWQGELMARTAGGSALPMRLTGQMLLDAQGNPELMLGTFVDISGEHASRVQREAQRQFTELLLDGAGVRHALWFAAAGLCARSWQFARSWGAPWPVLRTTLPPKRPTAFWCRCCSATSA